MAGKLRQYGWVRDLPDYRDHVWGAPPSVLDGLPAKVDLRAKFREVSVQGSMQSCTAASIAGMLQYENDTQPGRTPYAPSILFVYFNQRLLEGTVASDAGATFRSGMKVVTEQGDCLEAEWPYVQDNFAVRPPAECYDSAGGHKIVSYQSPVQGLNQLRGCLASGHPFAFGFTVFSAFESDEVARTGRVCLPRGDECRLGGHAVVAVG